MQSAAPRLSRIALPTGVELEYLEQGSRNGEVVVFLHGYTDSYRAFDLNLPTFPRDKKVYALTQRGHGDSSKPATGYAPADFAADVIAFLDAKGIARATLVGHSMGSLVAHKVAAEHPNRVEKLVLIGSGPTVAGNPTALYLEEVVNTLTDPVDPDFVREFQASTFALPIPPGFLDTAVSESLKVPASIWQQAMTGMLNSDHSALLPNITAPTLIFWGDLDGFFGQADQDALLAAIPDSRLIHYVGTGHAPHVEQPARFVHDLADFLR